MNAEQLQAIENEGRRLATVLLDAGYDRQTVLWLTNSLREPRTMEVSGSLVEWRAAQRCGTRPTSERWPVFIGALAVLEERGL